MANTNNNAQSVISNEIKPSKKNMKNKIRTCFIVSLVLTFIFSLFFAITCFINPQIKESDVIELRDTFVSASKFSENSCMIHLDENKSIIIVALKPEEVDDIFALQSNETIYFKIQKSSIENFNSNTLTTAYSLKTDSLEIVTLKEQNKFLTSGFNSLKYTLLSISLVLLTISAIMLIIYTKKKKD